MTKIFVGAIPVTTNEDMVRSYFEQYGKLSDCKLMMDPATGRNRGFAFVSFENPDDAVAVLEKSHTIDGREVDCKRAVSREAMAGERSQSVREGGKSSKGVPGPGSTNKLFVGGLPASCGQESLRAYFEKFGAVKDSIVMLDRASNRHRGFGFIEFEDIKSADEAMEKVNEHYIDDKWIEVKRAVPRGAAPAAYIALGSRPPKSSGYGEGGPERGGPSRDSRPPGGGSSYYHDPYGPPPYRGGGSYGYDMPPYDAYGHYHSYGPPPPHYGGPPPHGGYYPPPGYGPYSDPSYDPSGGYGDPYGAYPPDGGNGYSNPYGSNPYGPPPVDGSSAPEAGWESQDYYDGAEGPGGGSEADPPGGDDRDRKGGGSQYDGYGGAPPASSYKPQRASGTSASHRRHPY